MREPFATFIGAACCIAGTAIFVAAMHCAPDSAQLATSSDYTRDAARWSAQGCDTDSDCAEMDDYLCRQGDASACDRPER